MKKIFLSLSLLLFMAIGTWAQTAPFKLIDLPYATDALAPVISKQTIELHYGKHLQGYVNNVNKLIQGTDFADKKLHDIVRLSDGALYNNAGQMLNHNLYFTQFSPTPVTKPSGQLARAINAQWGSLDAFKAAFEKAGNGLFGSGWVWLAADGSGKLEIRTYQNGGNPVRDGLTPILGFDVWEHAYYLDYQNRRGEHLNKLWQIVDWKVVSKRY